MQDEERQTLGEEIIVWIESTCPVPEGALVGQSIALMPWQKREILRIYDNPATTRRAIISVGRKCGQDVVGGVPSLGAPVRARRRTNRTASFTQPRKAATRRPFSFRWRRRWSA